MASLNISMLAVVFLAIINYDMNGDYIYGLAHDCGNSSALALELP